MNKKSNPSVLGINRRNNQYLLRYNDRKSYPLVDNKLLTKQLLESNRFPTPQLFFEFSYAFEIRKLREMTRLKEFVVKPARGSGGRGILVITGRDENTFTKSSGEKIAIEDIEYHISNIIAGLYSLGGNTDQAFLEYRIHRHSVFEHIAYHGAPDIRIILYRGIPVMGMLRLPTKKSGGRANLHQQAIGVGIDMKRGITTSGICGNKPISFHPDTNVSIENVALPFWDTIINTAVNMYDTFKLGYIGIDFVIDQNLGPLILELNARPGLNIQLANANSILPRLNAVDRFGSKVEEFTPEKRREVFFSISG
jgi:alpha-L-glutamate ligase-like protein